MTRWHVLFLCLISWWPSAAAQFYPFSDSALQVNQVRARLYSNGLIGPNVAGGVSDFLVPVQDSVSPLYGTGLWMGGMTSQGQLRLAVHFNGSDAGLDFYPGPLTTDGSASITNGVSDAYDSVWVVSRTDVAAHIAYFDCLEDPLCDPLTQYPNGYAVPPVFLSWPAMGDVALGQAVYLAPFYDRDGDGAYDPYAGDHPCVPGDEALYVIFNDKLQPHTLSLGQFIGAEIHLTLFGFSSGSAALEQTIFAHYKVIYRGAQPLANFYFGTYADFDLGCRSDDLVGTDVGRSLVYVLNGDEVDEDCSSPGYGAQPPAFGVQILQGPALDPDGLDNVSSPSIPAFNGSGFNDGIVDNERHGIDRTMYFLETSANNNMTDPGNSGQFYNYLKSTWKNGMPLTFGDIGFTEDFSVPQARFMFPGDSDPNGVGTNNIPLGPWSENSAGTVPGERRALLSMGPITLEPGSEHQLLLAYVFARTISDGALASVSALQARADSVRAFVNSTPGLATSGTACGEVSLGIRQPILSAPLLVIPNPAGEVVTVRTGSFGKVSVELFDIFGVLIAQRKSEGASLQIPLGDLPPGQYIVRVIEEQQARTGRFVKE